MSKMTTNRQPFVLNQNSNNKRKYSSNNHSSLSSSTSLTSLAQPLNVNNLNFRLLNFSSKNNNDNTMNSNKGSRFTRLVRSKSGYTYTSLSENDNEDDENINHHNNNINNNSNVTKTPKSKHLSHSQNNNQTTPTRQRADSSSGMLDSSEWILFSPGHSHSNETASFNDDDVLSSTLERTESHVTGSGGDINEESYVNIDDDGELSDDEEEDEDDDNSLIDDLQDHIDNNIPFKKEDLNTRIDNWRRQQVNILLNDLSNDNAGLDTETIDLIKSWGIEDDAETSKDLKTNNLYVGNYSLIDKFYGDKLLNNYSNDDLKSLKKVLTDLSSALDRQKTVKRITKARKRELHHLRHLHQHQHHLHLHHHNLHHLHHLHHHDAQHYLPSSSTSSLSSSQSSKRDPNQFMNNKKLQKYIPIFLKNLIINSELLPEFEKLQKDELRFDEDDDKTDTEDSSGFSVTTVVRKSLTNIQDRKDSIISNFDRDLRSSSLVVVGNDEDDSKINKRQGKGSLNTRNARSPSENFWDNNDLQSVNSSILTYSTGSIVGF